MSPQTSPDDNPTVAPAVSATPGKTTTVHAGPAAVYRKLPPIVRQSLPDSCWAAALESWLVVNPSHGSAATQQELVNQFSKRTDGGLPGSEFDEVCTWYQMGVLRKAAKKLSATLVADRLRSFGHVLLIYRASGTFWHTHLAYGVGYPNGGDDALISVMDPGPGKYESHSGAFYRTKSEDILVAWPKPMGTP